MEALCLSASWFSLAIGAAVEFVFVQYFLNVYVTRTRTNYEWEAQIINFDASNIIQNVLKVE